MRLAQAFPTTAPSKYSRPPRARSASNNGSAEVPELERGQIDEWCDAYLARLSVSIIRTTNHPNKPPTARTSGTDAAILAALCSIMREYGCACFPAPEARVAERASVSETTAGTAMRRLENAAYIIRHPLCSYGAARKYSLVIEKLDASNAPRSLAALTEIESLLSGDMSDEAYRAKNLGKTAWLIYLSLLIEPDQKMADLSRTTGKSQPAIKRAVERMRQFYIADAENRRWYIVTRRVRYEHDLEKITDTSKNERSRKQLAKASHPKPTKAEKEASLDTTRLYLADVMRRSGTLYEDEND